MKLDVDPLDHENVLLPVPPFANAVAEPFEDPLQVLFVAIFMVIAVGCVIVIVSVSSQPLASDTVTV